jgi:hypothetical protein
MRTTAKNRQYRLHQKLAKARLRYNPKLKTIFLSWDLDITNDDIHELQTKFGYQVQFEIVSHKD